jgi:hypothetical protein
MLIVIPVLKLFSCFFLDYDIMVIASLGISYTKDGRDAILVTGSVPDAVEDDGAKDGEGGKGSVGEGGPGYGFAELSFIVVVHGCDSPCWLLYLIVLKNTNQVGKGL